MMLSLNNVTTGYFENEILKSVSLNIDYSECVAITGINGSGKSTVIKLINGTLPVWEGDILYQNKSIRYDSVQERLLKGIAISPQDNRVFNNLTVYDNLCAGCIYLTKKEIKLRIEEAFENFPVLKRQMRLKAGLLSGGEQQLLSIARALTSHPKLILLDEPIIGLSPSLVLEMLSLIISFRQKYKTAFLIVEHRLRKLIEIIDRIYILRQGEFIHHGKPSNKGTLKQLSYFIDDMIEKV